MSRAAGGLLALALLLGGREDRVVLQGGKEQSGRVVYEDEHRVVLRRGKRDATFRREEVQRVESRWKDLGTLLDNDLAADPSDPEALELLIAQAQECGLEGEARALCWRSLLRTGPEAEGSEPLHLALGHVKRARGWAVPMGNRTLDWDKRFQMASDWGAAWELESLHYRLRSNLPLETVVELLLDLERIQRAFYGMFGTALELFDVCDPMDVQVHGDSASYPEVANEAGRYDPAIDEVHVNASGALVFETLAHEATHQLLQNTAFLEKGHEGEIPPWVNEGLAEYVAAGVVRAPRLVYEPGRPMARHFRAHAQAKDPIDLTRVLSLSTGDYDASSDRALKYAQSYTLVHFLLHGEEGRWRDGFLEYLRTVYRGKGSSTDLKRCLDVDWRVLEKAWTAYVRAMKV